MARNDNFFLNAKPILFPSSKLSSDKHSFKVGFTYCRYKEAERESVIRKGLLFKASTVSYSYGIERKSIQLMHL